jgi:alkylation response protein AidB-like acyl-CoA dehydrogenase
MATHADNLVSIVRDAKRPDRATILDRIRETLPGIAANALATEQARQVPAENVEALRKAGLYQILQPLEFGGYEQDFDALAEAIQEIASACASTGWVCGLYAAHQWLLAQFPVEAQRDVWDEDADGMVCGSYAPTTKAEPVEGGYRISGRWSFASGCDHAKWALCAAMIPGDAPESPPRPAFMLVRAADYRIDDDWFTVGLAGTGSKTLVLDQVFVPAHRLLFFPDVMNGRSPGSRHHAHNPTFAVPMFVYFPACLVSAGLGAAAGALAQYIEQVGARQTRGAVTGGAIRMAEFPTIQIRVAEAAASIDAAREILMRDLRHRTESARAGRAITKEERVLSRRGQAFAVKLTVQAVEALNASTGGQGLALANPVQRAWRDVNATARHISFNWDAVGSMVGAMALGLEPKGMF